MTPLEARDVLRLLDAETSVHSVRAAFARRVKEEHPDLGRELYAGNVGAIMGQLKQARDVLLAEATKQNSACVLCSGSGKVRGAVGWIRCVACKGTGDKFRDR